MINRKLALFLAALLVAAGFTAATPGAAFAGRSACPATYVCSWNNASWTGIMAAFNPGYIITLPNKCLNFQNAAEQDAISSLASYNSAPNLVMRWYKDINCSGPGNPNFYELDGLGQVKDLKGTGWNDTFSSVQIG